jgi:prohibitin 1
VNKVVKVMGILLVLFFLVSLSGCGRSVPAGHKGVYFNWRSGTDVEQSLGEGWHWLLPWNRIIVYDVRMKDTMEKLSVLSSDQLNIQSDVSIRFRPDPSKVAELHQSVGADFYGVLIAPTLRNISREVIAKYESVEAYTKRQEIQAEIHNGVISKLEAKPILVEKVMLRNMDFPKVVTAAIEQKLAMKQEAEKMKYVLEKETLEAQRKGVEAKGIADFQRIVSQGINENLLRWKGIEATLKLAESDNSKVVVVGSGKDGLPLILGK